MSACLWNDIDAALVAAITADLTSAGDYQDLLIQSVIVGETINPNHADLPMVLLRGYEAEYSEAGPHMDGEIHIDEIVYPYELIALAFVATNVAPAAQPEYPERAFVAIAKQTGAELLRRLRECIRSRPALGGLSATDGEHIIDARIVGRQRVQVRGHTAQIATDDGTQQPVAGYLAAAALSLEIRSSI